MPNRAMEEAVQRIERHQLIMNALNYIRCRNSGGSLEECNRVYRLLPPPPGDPFFEELLSIVEPDERRTLLTAMRDAAREQLNDVEERLKDLDQKEP